MKIRHALATVLAGATVAGLTAPLSASSLVFAGSANATASVAADASCAPLPFRGMIAPASSSGTSNLGSFTYSHNACTQGATGPVNGSFALNFSGSALTGIFEGFSVARVGVPGLFDQFFNYTVTGGSGLFAGATGAFSNVGTVDVRGGPPSRLALNFNGNINAPAVPEPATWVMMILGMGLIGAALRRRRALNPPSKSVRPVPSPWG